MKKFAAAAIALVMIVAVFAIGVNAEEPSVQQPWYDVVKTDGDTFQFVGWAIIAGDDTLVDFGYRIDDNEPVFGFLQERSQEIVSVMNSDPAKTNGFNISIDAADVPAGEHTIHVVVKTSGGAVLDVNHQDGGDGYKVVGKGAPTAPEQGGETPVNPGTADASVIAIAAVACVALAGVVIAKKVR